MDREYRSRRSVLLVIIPFFCFSIIYRLVLGGDRVSPPFFCIYINGIKFIYCDSLVCMLNIFYICIPIYSSRTDRYYV